MRLFDGIYTPVITPMTQGGDIDRSAFARVIESLIEAGVHGIVVAGSTGEYYAQTPQERIALATYAKEVIGTRIPLVIGTGATRTEESIEYAKTARAIGADGILISTPPYALPTEAENAAHALKVDRAAGLPVMLYNYPGRMGTCMRREFFRRVTQSPNFVAIKESSGEIGQLHLLATEFPQLRLSCGWDDQALEFFAWGAPGWVCAASNFLPREHIALYDACVREGDFTKGRRIMAALMPLLNFLDEGKFVQAIKFGCDRAGLHAGPARAPLQGLEGADQDRLASIIATAQRQVGEAARGASDA